MRTLRYTFEMTVTAEDKDQIAEARGQLIEVIQAIRGFPMEILTILPTGTMVGEPTTPTGPGWKCMITIEEDE
jgi:hypothetical protein